MSRVNCRVDRKVAARPLGLAAKAVVALVACLALRVVLAQAPAGGGGAAEDVDARGFKVLVPFTFENRGKLTATQAEVRRLLFQAGPLGDRRGYFENYYTMYYFPMMTQTSDEALKGLPEERQRFFRNHLEYCKSAEAHSVLIGITLAQMQRIVTDTFHPAVRYNAMLIISNLNDVEPYRYSPALTPEPMAKALPVILTEFKRVNNSDAIKMAALLGLARHLEWEPFRNETNPNGPIQPAIKKEIIDELTALATMKQPPEGRDPAGHVWFRRRAVEALGLSCAKNSNPTIASTLDALLRDDKEPLPLRLTVATTLGRMSLPTPAIDAKSVAIEMGYLALVACDTELKRVTEMRKTEDERAIRLAGQLPGEGGEAGFGVGPRAGLGSPDGGFAPGGLGPRAGMPGPGVAGLGPQMPGPGGFGEAGGFGEGGAFGEQGFDPLSMDPKGYRFEFVRKRLRHQLASVQIGLLGGEDYQPPKAGAVLPPLANKPKAAPAGAKAGEAAPPPPLSASYGMRSNAKPADKPFIEDVYTKVRTLADIVENRSTDIQQLDEVLRRYMKPLEDATRKLAAPAAPVAEAPAADDDLLKPPAGTAPAPMPMPPGDAAPAPMPPGGKAGEAPMPPAGKAP